MPVHVNSLCYGDCLDWMQRWDDESVDLIYLDPPFNSSATYNVLYAQDSAGGAQTRAFADTWTWDAAAGERLAMYEGATARPAHKAIVGLAGILGPSGMVAYLSYMAERLEHMHRLLKPSGSIYYHCDETVAHYVKVVLDAIFGPEGYRGEVTWQRTSSHNDGAQGRRQYGRVCDRILFYTKGPSWTWNKIHVDYDQQYVDRFYRHLEQGTGRRYRLDNLSGPGGAAKGNPQYEVMGVTRYWRYSRERMKELIDAGRIVQTAPGRVPAYKRYLDEMPGKPLQDLWTDIPPIGPQARERLGYPTQKPRALMERIIASSSNEGDVVLDPFCGCGTTIEAARRLNRRWIGVDISAFAIDLIRERRLRDPTIMTYGIPADLDGAQKLAEEQPFAFESWAVTRLPGFAPNMKQRGDGGVDGRATLAVRPDDADSRLALAQVKGGKFTVSYLRDFRHVMTREHAAVGCFTTLEPLAGKHRADVKADGVVHVEGRPFDRVNLWSVAEYFDERYPPLPTMTDPYSGRPIEQHTLF